MEEAFEDRLLLRIERNGDSWRIHDEDRDTKDGIEADKGRNEGEDEDWREDDDNINCPIGTSGVDRRGIAR